jgi:predicted phage terminase large subunit-like protein
VNLNPKELSSFNISQIEDELKKEMARRKLSEYSKQAWHVVEPATKYIDNWHIDAIAEHLEAVTDGQIKRLLVNIPPRCEKSLNVAVFWPTWVWGPKEKPSVRWLFASYAESLSLRDSLKCRNVIRSEWYQKNWGNVYKLAGDQNEKRKFENNKTGHRLATSVTGLGTGEGGDVIVIDDPHNVIDGESDAIRETTLLWFNEVIPSRLNDPKTGAIVIVMQRVHERDVSAEAIKQGNYVHLCLPMEYEPKRMIVTPIGFNDPRTKEGELLWNERIGEKEVEGYKKSLGSYAYAGQYQQRPTPRGGGMIKRWWWKYWVPKGRKFPPIYEKDASGNLVECKVVELPDQFNIKIQSWDMSFDDTENSAFVVGQEWGQWVADRFLLDQVRSQMDFPTTIKEFIDFNKKWPDTSHKIVEKKANGAAVIKTLNQTISGIVPREPEGDKVARMAAKSAVIESGNVYIPHPALYSWVEEYLSEMTAFPKSAYKDQVDTTSQALMELSYDYPAPVKTILDEIAEIHGKASPEYRLAEADFEDENAEKIDINDL